MNVGRSAIGGCYSSFRREAARPSASVIWPCLRKGDSTARCLSFHPERKSLCRMAVRLEDFGLDVSYKSQGSKKIPTNQCGGGNGSETIRRKNGESGGWLEYLKSELSWWSWMKCHESDPIHETLSENCFVLGVTATPRRRGTVTQLGDLYKGYGRVWRSRNLSTSAIFPRQSIIRLRLPSWMIFR